MAQTAHDYSQDIGSRLKRNDQTARLELDRNLKAFIANALAMASSTPGVVRTSEDLFRDVRAFLSRSNGPLGFGKDTLETEAARQKAIESAYAFEEALLAAPPSARATALGLG